jgi:hypothetical protein
VGGGIDSEIHSAKARGCPFRYRALALVRA